jgi:hypothetical protein
MFKGLRTKGKDLGFVQASRPFQVRRWRLDELEDCSPPNAFSASKGTIVTRLSIQPPDARLWTCSTERVQVFRDSRSTAAVYFAPPAFAFPLSTDHLLHLVQFNVFRAFVSNKHTLNILLKGWTKDAPPPTSCPISGPYRDDTSIYPLNPNIPFSLAPTRLQQTRDHSIWINLFPFPRVRDNLIMHEGNFDHWELLQDLIGELMGTIPVREQQGASFATTVSSSRSPESSASIAGYEEDEITTGRKGLIVWGEPHNMHNWEVTPGFLAKWSWVLDGCDDLIESSNRWRLIREEEPMRLPRLRT